MDKRCALVVTSVEELIEKLKQIRQTNSKINGYFKGEVNTILEDVVIYNQVLENTIEKLKSLNIQNNNFEKNSQDKEKYKNIFEILANLYVKGYDLDWQLLHVGEAKQRISLPTYPFTKERYWIENNINTTNPQYKVLFSTNDIPSCFSKMMELINKNLVPLVLNEEHNFEEIDNWSQKLLLYIFQEMGVFKQPNIAYNHKELSIQLKIIPFYERLFEALLDILIRSKIIRFEKSDTILNISALNLNPLNLEKLKTNKEELKQKYPTFQAYIELLWTCLTAYPKVLTGKISHMSVMFPEGSLSLVEAIYQDSIIADYYNNQVVNSIKIYIKERLRIDPQSKINILEIGAGTGGTTRYVLKALEEIQAPINNYIYTDISVKFLNYGEEQWGKQHLWLSFQKLDIEKEVTNQDFSLQNVDIILATNVLHATKNIETTLSHIKQLLKPKGLLIINELSQRTDFATLTFGLTTGWWLFEDERNRIPFSPILSSDQWKIVLEKTGFKTSFLKEIKHNILFGHQIIFAESDGIIRINNAKINQNKTSKININHDDFNSSDVSNSNNKETISNKIQIITNIISKSLKIDPSRLYEDKTLDSFGMDSLSFLEILKRCNEYFGVNIKLEQIGSIKTIKSLESVYNTEHKPLAQISSNFKEDEIYSRYKQGFLNYKDLAISLIPTSYNINIETVEIGKGEPIIFLPPLDALSIVWKNQLLEFAKDHQVISFHYPGYGMSNFKYEVASLDHIVDMIIEVLDSLNINQPINLVGWSLSGFISQRIAVKYPKRIKSLVLVNTASKLMYDKGVENALLLMELSEEDFNRYTFSIDKKFDTITQKSIKSIKGTNDFEVTLHYMNKAFEHDYRDKIRFINTPTLIISGEQDEITTIEDAQYMHNNIQNSRFILVKSAGHYIPLFNSDLFNKELRMFLKNNNS